jgi:hypothetical protein
LKDTINPKHPLYQLEKLIPWEVFEEAYEDTYSDYGRPAKPVRLMVSLMILKHTYNLSDEETVAQWEENPYWQYFSGEEVFQWRYPCDPTDLVYFRKRIGEEGVEKLFEVSVKLHGKQALEKEVIADTTVLEKNITFPTDSKLQKRYEFGSKVSILTTKNCNIIVGAVNFTENIYDGNTLPPALDQYKRLMGKEAKAVLVDEGYRGRSTIGNTKVLRVHQKSIKGLSRWQKRQRFRRRSAIEPIIGHLKADYRSGRNHFLLLQLS